MGAVSELRVSVKMSTYVWKRKLVGNRKRIGGEGIEVIVDQSTLYKV